MDKKERILQMYFEEHQKQDIIAKTVGVSQSYISQVIQNHTIEGEGYCRVKDDVFALCLYDSSICTRRIEELIEQCVNASEKMPISISCGVVHILCFNVPFLWKKSKYNKK